MAKPRTGNPASRNSARDAMLKVTRLPLQDCETCNTPHRTKDGYQACVRHISGGYSNQGEKGRGCRNNPINGTKLCGTHGGKTPRIANAGKQRIAEAKATAVAARWGLPVDVSPVEAVLEQVKVSAGHVQFYKLQVEALENAHMVWGKTRSKTGGDDRGVTYEAGRNAWLTLYDAERDRLVKFCAEAIKAGIEERRVRIAEQQGALVADVIRAILGELALTEDQQAKIPELVPRHLRMLTGGAA